MAVPFTFGTATSSIPLSNLDSNFATVITLGNTAIQLGNTVTTLNNMTLANVTISSGNVTITNVTITTANVTTANIGTAFVSGNVSFTGTGNRITGDFSNATQVNRVFFQSSTTNGITIAGVIPNGTSTSSGFSAYNNSDPTNSSVSSFNSLSTETRILATITGTGTYLPMTFYTGGSERMRLDTSGNVGIGTSSPSVKLQVAGARAIIDDGTGTQIGLSVGTTSTSTGTNYGAIDVNGNSFSAIHLRVGNNIRASLVTSSTATTLDTNAAVPLIFGTNSTERMRLDSSGNLGLGVTPSAWGSGTKAFQLPGGSVWSFTSAYIDVIQNGFYNGTNNIYSSTAAASFYRQNAGAHSWFNAPSGTAGNAITFTQAMTLDASGNLGIGTTSPTTRLTVSGTTTINTATDATAGLVVKTFGTSGGTQPIANFQRSDAAVNLQIGFNGVTGDSFFGTTTNHNLYFISNNTERMRIDTSGNLMVGTTSAGGKLTVEQTGANANGANITNQTYNYQTLGLHNTATSGDNFLVSFITDASSFRGSITYNRAGGLVAYNTTSDYRAKDISGPVTGSGALIDSTPVYMGKMKDATQERPMFIAHEVPAYAHTGEKDAVDADGNPVYQQMDASALIPVMWAEIQSLRKRLTALEST